MVARKVQRGSSRVQFGRGIAFAAVAICAAASLTSFAQTIDGDHTISTDTKLTEDVTVNGQLILDGAAVDLNGHKLTVKGVTGQGVITDTLNDQYALYQELTYLESTTAGKQFIDTGYIHSTRSNVHIKFRHPSYPKNYTWFSYFGGGGRDAKYSFGGWIVYTGGRYYHWKSLGSGEGSWAGSSANTDYHLFIRKSSAAGDSGNCYVANASNSGLVTGVEKASATEWPTDVTPVTAYLFGHHNLDGTLNSSYAGSRIYLCEIKDGGTAAANLVRNFIPMKRRADDKPGMMDKVNDVFYTNANPDSTADFTAGPATATTLTATAAEIAAAGTLVLDIDEGDSVNLSSLKLYGKVKLVKTGKGTLVQDVSADWVCGIEVQDGQFQTTDALAASIKTDLSIKAGTTVSIACTGAASAVMPAAVSLEAGAKLLFDTTAFSGAGLELTVGGITFGEGATASECIATANPLYGVTLESATLIRLDRLTAPITAVWTGNGTAGNFDDPGNWNCYNKLGGLLDNTTLPSADTVLFRLDADADWTAKGAIALGEGVTLDLNGHNLTAASITGAGVVTDTTAADIIVADDGSMYQKIKYVQATQDGASNGAQDKIQYVDTGYYHVGTTKIDIRVEFQDVSYSGNYGYAVYYGCRDQNNYKTAQLGGWLHNSKFYYYDTSEHDGSTAYTGRIYDIRLDKGGSSYANYADGTRASTLGTGNGVGDSNTYGTDYIFANNQVPNGGKYWPCKCKVYSCKVYTGDTLERDFVPVRCISGAKAGQAGFWCDVTKKFYGNSGYGKLTAGPVVQSETPGGELHITVAENATLSLGGLATICGNVKVVKEGAGVLTLPADGQYFAGGLEIAGGTLSLTQTAAFLAGTPIVATAGGTIEIAVADGTSYANNFTLAGGTLKVLASGTGNTTTATIAGTLALATGAADAQPVVSIDMTDCSSATFQLNTTALNVGTGVTAAPGFVSFADPTAYEASIEGGTAIKVESLTSPRTAVWTGLGEAGNFDDPGNWSCSNKYGVALANTTLPDNTTLTFRLAADADWTAKGAITLGEGVTLDLNGQVLIVANSVSGGAIIDTSCQSSGIYYGENGDVCLEATWLHSTSAGKQFIDTGYCHNPRTVVDMKVEYNPSLDGSGKWYSYFGGGGRNGSGSAGQNYALGGWMINASHWKSAGTSPEGAWGTAKNNTAFTVHLNKSGDCTINGAKYCTGNGVDWGSTTPVTAYIFGHHNLNGTLYDNPYVGVRVYYCKISEGETVIRDFVPAMRITDGKPGMFDRKNNKFYVNGNSASTADFNIGTLAYSATGGGGELHITVAENATLSLADMSKIAGNVKIVKEGAGTLVAPTTGQYFTGGIEVSAGTLSMGGALAYGGTINAASGTTVSVPASVGSAGTSVINITGGTLEVANCGTSVVTGTVTLGGNAVSVAGSFAPVSGTAAHTITFADGATLDFTQWTGEFPVASPTIAYASGANITLKLEPATTALTALARSKDAETGKPNGYLFSWDSPPTDVAFSSDAATRARFRVVPDENGLRVSLKAGSCIIIK